MRIFAMHEMKIIHAFVKAFFVEFNLQWANLFWACMLDSTAFFH